MSESIALLSGKGGSGKTTIALGIASILSRCKIKVLLIDCDLCTNGATYFYENKLNIDNDRILSFNKILYANYQDIVKLKPIKINDYCDFVPSATKLILNNDLILGNQQMYKNGLNGTNQLFSALYSQIKQEYDIIIFDCQAGYTDILELILPIVNANLVVMEADAISSSAIRNLYLKIGNIIKYKKIYQVFNKVNKDEFEKYSSLTGGTVFTNIETIKFDWKIRKAFSLAQIPDVENTSTFFGEQLYNICKVMFAEDAIQKRLQKFNLIIKNKYLLDKEATLKLEIKNLNIKSNENRHKMNRGIISFLISLISIFTLIITNTYLKPFLNTEYQLLFTFVIFIIIILLAFLFLYDFIEDSRNNAYKLKEYDKSLRENKLKLKEMQTEINFEDFYFL